MVEFGEEGRDDCGKNEVFGKLGSDATLSEAHPLNGGGDQIGKYFDFKLKEHEVRQMDVDR